MSCLFVLENDMQMGVERYGIKPYKRGGWVIVEIGSGREIILFNEKENAEEACSMLNKSEY